jgi:hypothetical protein
MSRLVSGDDAQRVEHRDHDHIEHQNALEPRRIGNDKSGVERGHHQKRLAEVEADDDRGSDENGDQGEAPFRR